MRPEKVFFFLSLILSALVVITSCVGIYAGNFYWQETYNWQIQAYGQDVVDMYLVVPVLLITAGIAIRQPRVSLLWGGAILYLLYTFVIYSFSVHFNSLFLEYCIILGLCFFLFLYLLYTQVKAPIHVGSFPIKAAKITGGYFMLIALLFYALWLKEIIPAITSGTAPAQLHDTGLFTNPVHVIDLSVVLPGMFITGVLLRQNKPLGYSLAPVFLVFTILMNCTIGYLAALMKVKGLTGDFSVSYIMAVLTVASVLLLVWFLKKTNQNIKLSV